MEPLRGYDAWRLASPPEGSDEPCLKCDGTGELPRDGGDGPGLIDCDACEGSGVEQFCDGCGSHDCHCDAQPMTDEDRP